MTSPWWSVCLTIISIVTMYVAGLKRWYAWAIGLVGQSVWMTYAIVTHQYAFIISAVLHGMVYYKNLRSWRGDRNPERISVRQEGQEPAATGGVGG